MTLNIVWTGTVPIGPSNCALVGVPIDIIPQALGALRLKSTKYFYATVADHRRGASLLAELSGGLLMDCTRPIVDSIDRVYNLLDGSLNGTGRSVTGTGTEIDPYVYAPPLAQAYNPEDYSAPGLRANSDVARALLHNLVDGTGTPETSEGRNFRQQLEDIYTAITAIEGEDGPTAEQIAQIISILGAL